MILDTTPHMHTLYTKETHVHSYLLLNYRIVKFVTTKFCLNQIFVKKKHTTTTTINSNTFYANLMMNALFYFRIFCLFPISFEETTVKITNYYMNQ